MWTTFLLLLLLVSNFKNYKFLDYQNTQLNNNTTTQWSASRQKRWGSLAMKSMIMFGLFLHLRHASFAQSTVSSLSCEWVIFNTIHPLPLNLLLQEKVRQVAWVFYFSHSHLCFPWKKQLNMLACPEAISFWEEVPYFILFWQLLVFGLFFKSLFLGKESDYRYFQREKTEISLQNHLSSYLFQL